MEIRDRVRLPLVLCVLVAAAGMRAEEDAPPLAEAGKGACVTSELIFALEGRPTPECHASTIVETPSSLVAAWFAGTSEKHDDVGIRVARREGSRWLASQQVADGSEGEDRDYPCWNPVLFQPEKGPLLLFYKVGPSPSTWWGVLMTSADEGKTWSAPRRLGKDDAIGHLLGPVKNKPIALEGGAILCPSSTEHAGWRVHFELTRDLGKTWEVIGPIHDGREFSAIQPSILVHGGGRLQVLCRSRENVIVESWSSDGGKTWGPVTATSLPNPSAGTDAVTLADGRHLLVYNPTTRASGNRSVLRVAISADGKTWEPAITLERSPGEYSYPAAIQARDGKVHVTYTYRRQSIQHVVLDPAKLAKK